MSGMDYLSQYQKLEHRKRVKQISGQLRLPPSSVVFKMTRPTALDLPTFADAIQQYIWGASVQI